MSRRRSFYDEHGYLLVPDVLPVAEIDALRNEIVAIGEALRVRRGTLEAAWPGSYRTHVADETAPDAFRCDSIHDLQRYSAHVSRLVTDPRLVELFIELIGPNVALHHTKYHAKPPHSGAPFPLHQDYPHFPHAGRSMLVAGLFLDDAGPSSGCLGVVPGSHHRGVLPIVGPDEKYLDPVQFPLDSLTLLPAARGSVLFVNYLTIHGSTRNRSNAQRRMLFVQVFDPADRATENTHTSHAQGMMLAGLAPVVAATDSSTGD